MRNQSFFRLLTLVVSIGAIALAQPSTRADQTPVHAGYDLFMTDPSTSFDLTSFGFGVENFKGVPLGTYDFGSGPVYVGNTDTIIQRTQDVTTGGGTTNLVVQALQLESVNAIDGSGDHLFVVLNSNPSTGTMTIFDNDTFNSTLSIFFDLKVGTSLSGATFVASGADTLISSSTWTHTAPEGTVLIPGINYLLDGNDTRQDFWPPPKLGENSGGVPPGTHVVDPPTPEPSTWIMWVASGIIVPIYARWHRRRA